MSTTRSDQPADVTKFGPFDRWRNGDDGQVSVRLPSDFQHPPLSGTADSLIAHFEATTDRDPLPLRNPHRELKVNDEQRRSATPAAVLIPVVDRPEGPTVLLTQRDESISYAGHICFPGGRRDPEDDSALTNALREAEEEIGLAPERVRILGRLGDYVTHSGFRIAPFVGLVQAPLELVPQPGEVAAILEIPLSLVLRSDSYELRGWQDSERAHFIFPCDDVFVTGPTVSILMGLYETLLGTQEGSVSGGQS